MILIFTFLVLLSLNQFTLSRVPDSHSTTMPYGQVEQLALKDLNIDSDSRNYLNIHWFVLLHVSFTAWYFMSVNYLCQDAVTLLIVRYIISHHGRVTNFAFRYPYHFAFQNGKGLYIFFGLFKILCVEHFFSLRFVRIGVGRLFDNIYLQQHVHDTTILVCNSMSWHYDATSSAILLSPSSSSSSSYGICNAPITTWRKNIVAEQYKVTIKLRNAKTEKVYVIWIKQKVTRLLNIKC